MRRLAVLTCLLAAPGAAAGTAAAQERPPLRAQLVGCRIGDTGAERRATFRASMPAMARTRRMIMRFELRRREDGAIAFAAVSVPAWARWERSEPGRDGFVLTRRIDGLRRGDDYRALVRFRWYDADGREQRRTRRLTDLCRQPD